MTEGIPAAAADGIVLRGPNGILRVEGLILFGASIGVFATAGLPWWLYPVLLLTPDMFMLGYAVNTRLGAWLYNIGHSTILPLLFVGLACVTGSSIGVGLAAIWLGHIGMDRALGYGLKYNDRFKHTHLGDLEKQAS